MRNLFPTFLALFVIFMVIISRRPIEMLRRRGATSPDTAQPLDDLSAADRRRLDRLIAQGLIREASPGRYYFDVAEQRARIAKRMPWLIALIVVLALVAVWLYYYARPTS